MSEHGRGRLGCLVSGAALALALFVCFKAGPVYLDKIDFESELDRITRRAAVDHWDDRSLTSEILDSARSRQFELTFNDVAIKRSSRRAVNPTLSVDVHYVRRLQFPGYTHVFQFQSRVDSLTGSF